MSDPDVGLMLAFKGGDYHAFGRLVQRHSKAVINYFYFQCRDLDLAEDCTQEVWAKIFRSRAEYAPKARFRTYLLRVARNHWIDVYRTAARRTREVPLHAEQEAPSGEIVRLLDRIPAGGELPETELARRELAELLAAALARIPEEMREVFLLAEVEGLPYADIAQTLEIPEGTVKSRMFNAVRRLRKHLSRTLNERRET